jgi:inner membrane protein
LDNLTHSLVGWALAETGLKRRTRKGLAATVLAANLPDIDVFFGWAPWPPLAMHRGFTHGLIGGVLVLPPVLAILLWLLDRWQARRGRLADDGPPMRFGWLLALCWIGALTHPLLDLQNVYAIQLLSPASERWFHTDGLFIISPWLLAMLGLGIWRARGPETAARRCWRWRGARCSLAATSAFPRWHGPRHARCALCRAGPDFRRARAAAVLAARRGLATKRLHRAGALRSVAPP